VLIREQPAYQIRIDHMLSRWCTDRRSTKAHVQLTLHRHSRSIIVRSGLDEIQRGYDLNTSYSNKLSEITWQSSSPL
jgi:hypothetical protein